MPIQLAGKTAIVTGAASGVGLATARALVAAGARVVMADEDEARLEAEAARIATADGPLRTFPGDLCQKLTCTNLLALTADAFGPVDILVNAARDVVMTDPLSPDDTSLDLMLKQNLMAGWRLSQAVARRMIRDAAGRAPTDQRGLGAIVNLSSISARRAHPRFLAWSVASAAVDQMTRAMAVALAPHRIRVNGVAHGSVIGDEADALAEEAGARDEAEAHTPLARSAHPGEVAEAVVFLASDAAAYVTGQILTVDGGRTLIDPAALSLS